MSEQLIDHPAPESPSRRDMLKVGLGAGGALLVVFGIPSIAKRFQQDTNTASIVTEAKVETAPFAPNAFIRIERSGDITLTMPLVEMGQGSYTSLAMLLAEELEVGLDQVKLEHAPPNDALYANAIFHRQLTGMSSSIRAFWTPLRQAGAVARTLLITAAAKQWGVDPAVCWARHGVVSAGSRQLSYGQLVDAAAALPVPTPDSLALKDPKDFTLIGTPAKRLDTPDKVNGHAEFGIDTKQPGMKVAAIAISPVFGGKPKSLDEAAARAVKGVRQVVRVDEAVAVVADHMGAAKKGLAAAAIQWDDGPNAKVSSADIVRQLEEASKQPGVVVRNEGDTEKALGGTDKLPAIKR
jgi:isoquinoline 1-oxidoreductase beta subunit